MSGAKKRPPQTLENSSGMAGQLPEHSEARAGDGTHGRDPEEMAYALRQVLLRVPHGTGDHTDLCRMQNEGLPPMDDKKCHCHVGRVRAAIRDWHL